MNPAYPPHQELYHAVCRCSQCAYRPIHSLVQTCQTCGAFYYGAHLPSTRLDLCHPPRRLVYVDGACLRNGSPYAVSGLGIALGIWEDQERFVAVNDALDNFPKRSNQRAELLAAMEGIRALESVAGVPSRAVGYEREREQEWEDWTVLTDSEYVVKGMTEWAPQWESNGWRKPDGSEPDNVDLFYRLREKVELLTNKKIWVEFGHVLGMYNTTADRLSRRGAEGPRAKRRRWPTLKGFGDHSRGGNGNAFLDKKWYPHSTLMYCTSKLHGQTRLRSATFVSVPYVTHECDTFQRVGTKTEITKDMVNHE